jgi:hypothetical protein
MRGQGCGGGGGGPCPPPWGAPSGGPSGPRAPPKGLGGLFGVLLSGLCRAGVFGFNLGPGVGGRGHVQGGTGGGAEVESCTCPFWPSLVIRLYT